MNHRLLLFPVSLLFFTAACEKYIEPTYHGGVRALIEAKCVECHREGGIAPFALDDAATVRALGPSIVEAVETRTMPPFGHDTECRDVVDSLRLEPHEIAAFVQWRDTGYPDGDPASYEPPRARDMITTGTVESQLGPADVVIAPSEAYLPDVQRPDDYRCIPLPYEFERDTFLNTVDVLPDQVELVHHVIVYAVPASGVATLEELDAADPGPGFNCFSDAGIDGADVVGGWVPGATNGGDRSVATKIGRGARLVLQMHYNTAGREQSSLTPDATGAAIWILPEGQYPDYLLTALFIDNPFIEIPAGASSAVATTSVHVPIRGWIAAVSPHMHLLGKRFKTELIRDDGDVECLADVQNWDFDWQRTYEFTEREYVEISIDDEIRVTCEYDNSAANQPVINGQQQEPQDVFYGEGTRDEMCLESLIVVTEFRGQGEPGVCGGYRDCAAGCDSDEPFCALYCMSDAGFACLGCGTEGLLGECAASVCPVEDASLGSCLSECPQAETDLYGCLWTSCRSEFAAYYECVSPTIENGICAGDFEVCEGMTP